MIHLGLLLLVGGVTAAIVRDKKNKKNLQVNHQYLPTPSGEVVSENASSKREEMVFDDVAELEHYQRVSWYGLALTTSGVLFYPPVSLVSLPLLGYNAYHFFKTLKHSSPEDRKSAIVIFECIGVFGTLLVARPVAASLVMAFAYTKRNFLLQAGNISNNMNPSQLLQMRNVKVWVLRDGVEVESLVSELQEEDTVVFHQGDTLTIEGIVVEGVGEVNQFSLEKKMKTVPKKDGDRVFPFTLLKSGCLHVSPA
jgi:cation transport ATPase